MVSTLQGPTPATPVQLLLAAERLFAEHGLAGVSLGRQISIEAGSSNNSAIQYHFGSKDDLLRAIFAYRLSDLMQRRALLKARARPDDLRAQLEAHILPLIELAESPDSIRVVHRAIAAHRAGRRFSPSIRCNEVSGRVHVGNAAAPAAHSGTGAVNADSAAAT